MPADRVIFHDEPKVVIFGFASGFALELHRAEVSYCADNYFRFLKKHWTNPEASPVIQDIIRQVKLFLDDVEINRRLNKGSALSSSVAPPEIRDEEVLIKEKRLKPPEAAAEVIRSFDHALDFLKKEKHEQYFDITPFERIRDIMLKTEGYPKGDVPLCMDRYVAGLIHDLMRVTPGVRIPRLGLFSTAHDSDSMEHLLKNVLVEGDPRTRDYTPQFKYKLDSSLGRSQSAETYKKLASYLGVEADRIYIFLTKPEAVVAARYAGLKAFHLDRKAPLTFVNGDLISFMNPSKSGAPRGKIQLA